MKSFFLNSKNIDHDSVIWNMLGSMLMAFQSVIFLIILTRVVGLEISGVFTIAYANANLFLNIGKYGMRNYQVSDVKNQFSFNEYLCSRWITSAIMIVVSLVYVCIAAGVNGYSPEKSQIIIWMCLFKVPDAMEDIYYGQYQKKGRLDVASKIMTVRMGITILLFGIVIFVSKNLLITLITATGITTLLTVVFINWTSPHFCGRESCKIRNIGGLLWNCFPAFAGLFLSFYIGNASKYAIDAQLSDEIQACYGFIAMPVFVIGVLNGFILNPLLYKMSCLWSDKNIKEFTKKILFLSLTVSLITIVCVIGAYILGIPVLSLLYNTDLSLYKAELLILLLGGGFLGLSGVFNAAIIIIRCQRELLYGYAIVAVLAFVMSKRVVGDYGITGASVLYSLLMAVLCVFFIGIFVAGILGKGRKQDTVDGK